MAALRLLRDFAFWPAAILVALACAIAGLAAQAGGFSLTLDVAAHFAPFWLAGAAAAALASMVFRGWRRTTLAAVGLVGVVAAGLLILPEYLRDTGPHAPPTAAGRLKVVQLNAWYGNPDRDRILRWLAAERRLGSRG